MTEDEMVGWHHPSLDSLSLIDVGNTLAPCTVRIVGAAVCNFTVTPL